MIHKSSEMQKKMMIFHGSDMTDKQLQEFKKQVYEPYTEAWTIMKAMRDADQSKEGYWQECADKVTEFSKKYPSELGDHVSQVMLSTLDIIGKITKGAN